MKLKELLKILQDVAFKIGEKNVYLIGGVVRDKYMGHLENVSDIDITTFSNGSDYLSEEFYNALRKQYNITRKILQDHTTMIIGNLKVDFSSNFVLPNIDQALKNIGIANPTNIQKEIYSRDFTINTLAMSLDLKTIHDFTHRGFKDIKDKKIRTCLSPEISLTSNRNRVARAIYLSSKLAFDIDNSIIKYVKQHPDSIKISTETSLKEKLNSAFQKDGDRAAFNVSQMGLWNFIPITPIIQPYYKNNLSQSVSKSAQRNYDMGAGLYENMNKYKSVKDFINNTPKGYKSKKDNNEIDYPIDDDYNRNGLIYLTEDSYQKPEYVGPAGDNKRDLSTFPSFTGEESYDSIADANPIGWAKTPLHEPDFEGKMEGGSLNFGYDYTENDELPGDLSAEDLAELANKYLTPAESDLFGMPDGIDPISDLDAENTIQTENPFTGTSNISRQPFDNPAETQGKTPSL